MLLQIQLLDSLIDADLYESKPCKIHNHHQKDGRGIRTKYMRTCVGCRFNLPPGLMDLQFDNIEIRVHKNKKYMTAEESRKKHVEHVMNWEKRNQEKVRAYREKYRLKNREKHREEAREKYKNFTPEQKEHIKELQRIRYKNLSEEKKEQRRIQQREKYKQRESLCDRGSELPLTQMKDLRSASSKQNDTA